MKLHPAHIGGTAQHGISMVELMIAMLLGLFLMAGVLQLFSSNKSTYSTIEGLSQIQDNARAGMERIKSRVRMAAYMGCSNLDSQNKPSNITVPEVAFNANIVITGTNNDSSDALVVDGTDTVKIISATLANTALSTDMPTDTSDVPLTKPGYFQINNVMIITDCEYTDIFRITNISDDGLNIAHDANDLNGNPANAADGILSKAYLASSTRVMSLQNVTYSVQATPRVDESGNAVLSLFETPSGGTPIEIMTGVEDMQITYGEGSDGEADIYNDASDVSNWANVVSVRLKLLLSTDRGIGPDPRPYVNLAGTLIDAASADRRMRRTFTTTISLRNRSS